MSKLFELKILPRLETVGKNLGDLIQPNDCRDGFVGRRGWLMYKDDEIEVILVACSEPLCMFSLKSKPGTDEWEHSTACGTLPNLEIAESLAEQLK